MRDRNELNSLGAGIIAALAVLLAQIASAIAPPPPDGATCAPAPPFAVSLSQAAAASTPVPAATPRPARTPVASPSPMPAAVAIAALPALTRPDDPPANHDLLLVEGAALPLVIP
ncbi:MAG TPA: hypothetical protein VFA70_02140, partial [Dehalococcoidia bacterium]|nr:hypothetical protein [Dehalococcoidia bacterium]